MRQEFYNFSKWYKFEKWLKKSKLEISSTRISKTDYGRKTDKLILIFLWIIIDQFNFENYKKQKNLNSWFEKSSPTIFQIAKFVNCHESYVKRMKAKMFNSDQEVFERFESEFLNIFGSYGEIKNKPLRFKEMLDPGLNFQQEEPKIERSNIFENDWKVKKRFYTFNKKLKCQLFFYKVSKVNFEIIKNLMKSLKINSTSKILEKILLSKSFNFYFRSGWKFITEIKSRFKLAKGAKYIQQLF